MSDFKISLVDVMGILWQIQMLWHIIQGLPQSLKAGRPGSNPVSSISESVIIWDVGFREWGGGGGLISF